VLVGLGDTPGVDVIVVVGVIVGVAVDVIVAVGVAVGVTVDVGVAVGVTAVIGIFKMVSQGEFDSTIIIVAVESH
jgi:hypothetical protein